MSDGQPAHRALVDQILAGQAPEHIRAAAARGALPLPPAAMAEIYLCLRGDDDVSVSSQAEASLASFSPEGILEMLRDPDCAGAVLTHYAAQATKDALLAERIAFHPSTPVDALAILAAKGNTSVIDLVVTNQEKLLEVPQLLERLMANPALRPDQRGKILDVLDRISQAEQKRQAREREEAEAVGEGDEAFVEAARLLEVDVGELFEASEITDGHEFAESEDDEVRSAYQRILRMNPAQKAIAAMKGDREMRQILIRDTNKTVSLGVLKNPRLTELEIESIAKMRNVNDEVLRRIGSARDWSKNPSVRMALLLNPRTPPAVSTNFIPLLQGKALKDLSRNREVPELIRRMARRTLAQRQAKEQNRLRK